MKRSILLLVAAACLSFSGPSHGAAVDDGRIIEAERTALLPLRLISDEGVFVVYDAAVPWTERDARARYVGWWLGANDPQAYVYSALVYHSYGAVEAMIDLSDQFGVDLEPLTADVPDLRKRVARELEQREAARAGAQERPADQSRDREGADTREWRIAKGEDQIANPSRDREGADSTEPRSDEATAPRRERQSVLWIPATRDTVLALMGFSPAPDPETDLIGPDVNIVDPCAPPEGCDPVLQFVGATQPRHRGFVSALRAISEALNLLGGRCDSCGGGGCTHPCCYVNCKDSDPCTSDWCVDGVCGHGPLTGPACAADGTRCTGDVCINGKCEHVGVGGVSCEPDGNDCTTDVCGSGDQAGICLHNPSTGGVCEPDGLECTLDRCLNGHCYDPNYLDGAGCTDDGNSCTLNKCQGGVCTHPARDCNDHVPCTIDGCDPATGCTHDNKICDDGKVCTGDWCDGTTGQCVFNPFCTPNKCCPFGEGFLCCPWPNAVCCAAGPDGPEHCCESGTDCCGAGCCQPDQACCHDECVPKGACCFPETGACIEMGEVCCTEAGGTYLGVGAPCCGGPCCGGPCCNGQCCPSGGSCCGGQCCAGPCCEATGECCPAGGSCCNNECCAGPCCVATGQCCAAGGSCCNDICCPGPCCEGTCCPGGASCCGAGCCAAGTHCCPTTGLCCPNGTDCCGAGCCPDGTSHCCPDQDHCCPNDPSTETCCGDACCAEPAICCSDVCDTATCSLNADSGTVCPGKSIDIQGVAVCNPDCLSMSISAEVIEPEYQTCVAVSVSPGSVVCGPVKNIITLTVSVFADAPLGVMTVRLTGHITGAGGAVICESTADATITVDLNAILTADPTLIPAASNWDFINVFAGSQIDVTWDPPDCEGILAIVKPVVGDGGFVPPSEGTLRRENATRWIYGAFLERKEELCPQGVNVRIAAKAGDTELHRVSVRVVPIHYWWTHQHKHYPGETPHQPNTWDFGNDYDYLFWKYAGAMLTTGGEFSSVVIDTNTCVPCGSDPCTYACTSAVFHSTVFGTNTFTSSENQAASIIGHELMHTTIAGFTECSAYRWEADHAQDTGIASCDIGYLQNVLAYLSDPDSGCQ